MHLGNAGPEDPLAQNYIVNLAKPSSRKGLIHVFIGSRPWVMAALHAGIGSVEPTEKLDHAEGSRINRNEGTVCDAAAGLNSAEACEPHFWRNDETEGHDNRSFWNSGNGLVFDRRGNGPGAPVPGSAGTRAAGAIEAFNNYGVAVAAGDFNGDGVEDLVTGANGDGTGGSIIVNFGCPTGITHFDAQRWTLGTLGFTDMVDSRFGLTLAVGDFDDDGYDDVAVGAPGYDSFRGAVVILFGRATGLGPNVTWISQDNGPGAYEAGDNFGGALAAGDFNNDGYDDLAVGSYFESLELNSGTVSNAGAVSIFLGGANGPYPQDGYNITEEDTNVGSSPNANFGWALAAGDINGDDRDDLVVGVPRKTNASIVEDGAIHVFFGASNGPTTTGAQYFAGSSMSSPTLLPFDKFGYRLACGDGNGDGFADVAIGMPEADVSGSGNAGRTVVMYGAAAGLSFGNKTSHTGNPVRTNDRFGEAVAFGRYDASSDLREELAVGAPSLVTSALGGQVTVFQGAVGGYTAANSTIITQATLNEVVEAGDRFGASLAFGRFVGGQRRGLAVGAPNEDWNPLPGNLNPAITGAGAVSIDINWMQVQNLQCRAALLTNCSDQAVFSLKPFEPHLLASTSKIMTALVAIESTEPGCDTCSSMASTYTHPQLLCDSQYPTSPNGTVGGSDSAMCPGETNSLQNLIWHMLFPSGNDAAFGIADLVVNPGSTCANTACQDIVDFVQLMNDKAAELGMPDTSYQNPSGAAHASWPSNNISSPWDQARLAYFAMQNTTFFSYVSQPTSPVLPRSGGCWPLGSTSTWGSGVFTFPGGNGPDFANTSGLKPGNTPAAGNTLVVALDEPLGRMFGIILGEPSGAQMRTDMGAMLNLGRTTFCSGIFDPTPSAPGTTLTAPNKPSDGGKISHFAIPMQHDADHGFNVRITASPGTALAAGRLELNRDRSMVLPAGDTTTSAIEPFVSHQGILITNLGEDRAELSIRGGTHHVETVTLPAGASHLIPPFAASSIQPDYVVLVANLSST
ncbi:MAG: FG-GAP repeat protein [Planctomycetes bacterium]|nr:FG-GAP repeat protein [Planctomycetota bacterium]